MFDKLEDVERRFMEIESKLADPEFGSRPAEFRRLSQEHADLKPLVEEYRRYRSMTQELQGNKELLGEKDATLADMAKEEIKRLEPELELSKKQLQIHLLPKDPNDAKNVVLEIRAGAGGDEAALF